MKNETKTRVLQSSGLRSDATRIIRNARATLNGARISHANGTTFAAIAGATTKRTVKTAGGNLTFLSDGAAPTGYESSSESSSDAAETEARLRKLGQHAMASDEELRMARKRHHMQNGMDADDADELTKCSDEELEAKCSGEESDDDIDMSDDDDDDIDEAEEDFALSRGRADLDRSVGSFVAPIFPPKGAA